MNSAAAAGILARGCAQHPHPRQSGVRPAPDDCSPATVSTATPHHNSGKLSSAPPAPAGSAYQ